MSAIAHGEGDETVLAVSRILADWTKANKKLRISADRSSYTVKLVEGPPLGFSSS